MLNCSIYISGNVSEELLISELCDFLNGRILNISFVELESYILFVQKNDEFDSNEQSKFPDGFLYFQYILFIDFMDQGTEMYCVAEVSKILHWLWNRGLSAVSSCDYEHLLPENGGYNSRNVPWVAG
jgi:hypothetical protein